MLSNRLNVVRDRGKHPSLRFNDNENKLKFQAEAGESASLSPNIVVKRKGERIEYNFSAPTREEAERILKKNLPKGVTIENVEMKGIPRQPEPFTADFELFRYKEMDSLRAVVKIALAFCRLRSIPISQSAIAVRFLRGDTTSDIVGAVRRDVVSLAHAEEHPLTHSIYVWKTANDPTLYAYLVLFEVLEFIIKLDEASHLDECSESYRYSIVTAQEHPKDFAWIAIKDDIDAWISSDELPLARVKQRMSLVQYWLDNALEMWGRRATAAAAKTFVAAINEGKPYEEALRLAQTRGTQVGDIYGLDVRVAIPRAADADQQAESPQQS